MSETTPGAPRVPKAVIEQEPVVDEAAAAAAAAEASEQAAAAGKHRKKGKAKAAASSASDSAASSTSANRFQDATVGFFQGLGRTAWAYADAHPHTVLYGLIGFVLAVLILVIGLWDTIVIAVFVAVGAIIGQMVDGDNAIVNFFSRLFSGRR